MASERKGAKAGFTLIEAVIVSVIISISVALVAPSIGSGLKGVRAKSAAMDILSTMKAARAAAIRQKETCSVRVSDKRITLDCSGLLKKELILPEAVEVEAEKAVSFYPGGRFTRGGFTVRSGKAGYTIKSDGMTVKVENLKHDGGAPGGA